MQTRDRVIEYLMRRKFKTYAFRRFTTMSGISTAIVLPPSEAQEERKLEIASYRAELNAKSETELELLQNQEWRIEQQEVAEAAEKKNELLEATRYFNLPNANADFVYWSKMAHWTIDEAVALTFGKAPEVVKWERIAKSVDESKFARRFSRVYELATRALAWKQLFDPVLPGFYLAWAKRTEIQVPQKLLEEVEARGVQIADWKTHYDELSMLFDNVSKQRDQLLKDKEAISARVTPLAAELVRLRTAEQERAAVKRHDTDLMRKLRSAADKFWSLYDPKDPTTAPKNDDVSSWLETQGVSKRVAEVMAQILRADGLPTGPRK